MPFTSPPCSVQKCNPPPLSLVFCTSASPQRAHTKAPWNSLLSRTSFIGNFTVSAVAYIAIISRERARPCVLYSPGRPPHLISSCGSSERLAQRALYHGSTLFTLVNVKSPAGTLTHLSSFRDTSHRAIILVNTSNRFCFAITTTTFYVGWFS